MEQIGFSQTHLWLAHLDEVTDATLLAEYRTLLSGDELQRRQSFHFERDRHRYFVTRALVHTVLSTYADVDPRAWRFAVNEYGKPSIAAERSADR